MTLILTRMRAAAAKRAAYRQTVRELSGMPLSVAQDLGLFREDAEKIAWKHVYGA